MEKFEKILGNWKRKYDLGWWKVNVDKVGTRQFSPLFLIFVCALISVLKKLLSTYMTTIFWVVEMMKLENWRALNRI